MFADRARCFAQLDNPEGVGADSGVSAPQTATRIDLPYPERVNSQKAKLAVTNSKIPESPPIYTLPVYRSQDITVVAGANLGDTITDCAHLILEDVYSLRKSATPTRLSVTPGNSRDEFLIASDSVAGAAGASVYLDCCITLMSQTGETSEAIVVVETSAGLIAEIYLMALSALVPAQIYTLVKIDRSAAKTRFSDIACVSFTRGTHILLADGSQTVIETLQIGDAVMTRDHGAQTIRWIGKQTYRAIGDFAPILIRSGALNNSNDLCVGPNHRLFVYQRTDQMNVGQSEVTIRAGLLINGTTVVQVPGGFVDYYQLLFDRHEVIYIEGIAAETMLADHRARLAIPPGVRKNLTSDIHRARSVLGHDLQITQLNGTKANELLRRASEG
ncbi:MAG: Hint domain-containing protein [Marinosulfonomonas sp.]|nr:Hint domain-containing protein [Marinosulfonomonas sp.]